jgi:myo-inositol-1(or 4)-monophosphatase
MLEALREIGDRLVREIGLASPYRVAAGTPPPPRGAAGDRTFPVDSRAEEIIISGLRATDEALTLISEEAGRLELNGGGGRLVLVDPIDGSKNAISGIPFYCTSMAVAEGARLGDVTIAYVVNLITGEGFHALRGGGAFLNGRLVTTQKDDVFRLTAFEAQTPGRDISRLLPVLSRSRKARCLGAVALDLAYLSAGAVSVFVNPSASRSFDFAAGWLLVREAGGLMTDFEGGGLEEVELGLQRTKAIIASGNSALHEEALELLRA